MLKQFLIASILLIACINLHAADSNQLTMYDEQAKEYLYYELHSEKNGQLLWVLMNRKKAVVKDKSILKFKENEKISIWNEKYQKFVEMN